MAGVIIQMAGTRITFAAIIVTALAVLLPAMTGYVGERRLQKQLRAAAVSAAAVSEAGAPLDVETPGRLSTQHQRNLSAQLHLSQQNLQSHSASLNPIRESETRDAELSMASTVVLSTHVKAILSADYDTDAGEEEKEKEMEEEEEEEREYMRSARFSSADLARRESGSGSVEMSAEEREKTFISTDMTLYNTHRKIFWLGLWVSVSGNRMYYCLWL